jgi:hypothetical protein
MPRTPPRFLIVVPTRNRADLASAAVASVLRQAGDDVHLVVSDNSTQAEESRRLERLREGPDARRIRLVRPPEPLPMGRHWDWALGESLRLEPDTTHVLYLTDRMVFRSGGLQALLGVAARHPDRVISCNLDRVDDASRPVRLEQNRWSGAVIELRAEHLLAMTARFELHRCLPAMLNTVAPRGILDRIRERFGGVFDSISPDFCFAYRCLSVVDTILYVDRAPLIHYAAARSNGASMARGIPTADSLDFRRNLDAPLNFATPAPAIPTPGNAVLHEYGVVKRAAAAPLFPDIDLPRYLRGLRWELEAIEDPALKDDLVRRLEEQADALRRAGVTVDLDLRPPPPPPLAARLARVLRAPGLLADRASRGLRALRRRLARLAWQVFRAPPPADCDLPLEFDSTADALAHGDRAPRGPVLDLSHLAPLDGRTVEPAPGASLSP